MKSNPRLIQTYLPDGTLEGLRIIELDPSAVKAFVIPRLKIASAKERAELSQPALYLLINSGDNQLYIGESENFLHRMRTHDQAKGFWDIVIAIISSTNKLEKSDIKYLESLAVERAKSSAAMEVLNKTVPARNNVHEFKLHSLQTILDDTALIAESLGYSIFATAQDDAKDVWYCKSKNTDTRAQFRGDKFVVLAGSRIDKGVAPSWAISQPNAVAERQEIFAKYGRDLGDAIEITENVPFKSPNHAGKFAAGRSVNAWTTWKDPTGRTMDEVIRKEAA